MQILEFKMDANQEGNAVIPGFVSHSISPAFFKAENYSYISLRLSEAFKVPDSVNRIASRADLKTRNRGAGLLKPDLENPGQFLEMSNEECDAATDSWCDQVGVD